MKVKRKAPDILMDIVSLLILLFTSFGLYAVYAVGKAFSNSIPLIYDPAWDSPATVSAGDLVLLGLGWVIWITLTVLSFFPRAWNPGVQVTEENRQRVYSALLRLISSLKLALCAMVCVPILWTVPWWAWPLMFACALAVLAHGLIRIHRAQ